MPKLQNNQKNMNNNEFLIINFYPKNRKIDSKFYKFSLIFYEDVINADIT